VPVEEYLNSGYEPDMEYVDGVLQMDPEEYVARRFDNGSMIETAFKSLILPTGKIPFDSEELVE
jgi:hypothetical protein